MLRAFRDTLVVASAALAVECILTPTTAHAQSSFQGIGFLTGGTSSYVQGINSDGSVVVGQADSASGNRAFRWTQSGGLVGLGLLPGGTFSRGFTVSSDGSVIVGYGDSTATLGGDQAFRWTQSGGMIGLGLLPGGTFTRGFAVSSDGSVVVGTGNSTAVPAGEAFRWTQGGGMVGLGVLGGGSYSSGLGVSGDGSVVVGTGDSNVASREAFRWTQGGGMVGLGLLPGGTFSRAYGVNGDGSVVVGDANSTAAPAGEAFRWTQSTGKVGLGVLPGGAWSQATAVNNDGSVVVGVSLSTAVPSGEAFRWTQSTGMQSVKGLLTASGVSLTGWTLGTAYGVSANGNIIVGYGQNPASQQESWIARLCDPSACPSGGGSSGLVTVSNQMTSFASVGSVGQTANASLGGNFGTVTNYATQGGTPVAPGSPFSVFTAFGYDSDPTISGTIGGTVKLNDRGLIVGVTTGADNIRTTGMSDGGSARMNAGTLGFFIAQVPEAGFQWLAGANAIYLAGKITRGYLNGTSEASSTGSTHGTGFGFAGRLGYTFANASWRTSLTPFASYTYTRVDFAGYTETTGPFPALMDSLHAIEQVSRLGTDVRFDIRPGTWTWGTLAWGHRLDAGRSADVSGTLIGLFPISTTGGMTAKRDWAEATTGLRFAAGDKGAVTTSLTANVPQKMPTTFVAHLGYSKAF